MELWGQFWLLCWEASRSVGEPTSMHTIFVFYVFQGLFSPIWRHFSRAQPSFPSGSSSVTPTWPHYSRTNSPMCGFHFLLYEYLDYPPKLHPFQEVKSCKWIVEELQSVWMHKEHLNEPAVSGHTKVWESQELTSSIRKFPELWERDNEYKNVVSRPEGKMLCESVHR